MSDKQFAEECLSVTNGYRDDHQVEPLSYNKELEKVAKNWAAHLTKTNKFEHNPNATYKGKELGENIAGYGPSPNYSASQAVAQWYNEVDDYDFQSHQGIDTGHFTQLVWKGSKEMGVGRSKSEDGKWIAVANYFPPGNIIGKHPQNVLPPRDGKKPVLTTHDDEQHPPKQNDAHAPNEVSKNASSYQKAERRKRQGNVMTITTTETTKSSDGVTTVKVTEKVSKPGQATRVKVTETTTAPDGRQVTKTSETTEK